MSFTGDERAQSIQVGAVLLFAVLIIAFSSYQAFAVPNQNQEVEFNHNQQVHTEMQDLRNAIVSVPGATSSQSISVTLGTQYPSRAIARNPSPPSGALRTNGTADSTHNVTVRNAQARGETGDYWTGASPKRFNSGTLVYSPNYNVYDEAPTTYYEHSLVYNQFRNGDVALTGQTLVNGREISIVTLNGSLSQTSSGAQSVDVKPISQSSQTVSVTNDTTGNVSISFLSRLPASAWNDTLSEEVDSSPGNGDDDRYIADVSDQPGPGPYYNITLTFERGVDYRLQMAKAGVGTRVSAENATYLTNESPTSVSITTSETADLVVEARDGYNNPVADRTVNATVAGTDRQVTTDEDGQATISVDGGAQGPGTTTVNASLRRIGANYDSGGQRNVTFTVDVSSTGGSGSGNSAYSVFWKSPTTDNDNSYLSGCTATDCTWDVSADSDRILTLRAGTNPALEGNSVDFSINNSTVGTVSPGDATTGSSGEVTTELTANNNGTIGIYSASGGTNDVINVTLENVRTVPVGMAIYRDGQNLASVEPDGTTRTYGNTQKPEVLGPSANLDGDTAVEVPYITSSGGRTRLNVVDADGNGGNKATLFDSKDNPTPSTSGRMGVGDLDEDGTNAVFLVDGNSNLIKYEDGEGVQTISAVSEDVSSVAGVGDFDGDGSPDLIYTNGDQEIKYYDGSSTTAGTGVSINTASAIGEPSSDLDGDDDIEEAYISGGSPYFNYADSNGQDGSFSTSDTPLETPIGVSDWDGDGSDEIIFLDQNGFLKYANSDGTTSFIRDSNGNRISTGNTGQGVVVGEQP